MFEVSHRSILLTDYMSQVEPTDQLPADDLQPILLGLFGEVGSIMATAKKFHREKEAYAGYRHAVEEEFGDALWYFTALCRRLNVRVDEILASSGQRGGLRVFGCCKRSDRQSDFPCGHAPCGPRTRHCASSAGRGGCWSLRRTELAGRSPQAASPHLQTVICGRSRRRASRSRKWFA